MRISLLTSLGITLDSFFPELVEVWEALGHRVFTASQTPSDVGKHTQIGSLTRRPSFRNVAAHRDIAKWLARTQADILMTNTATASALARAKRLKIPVVYFCHGLHWNATETLRDRTWQFIEELLIENTDAVITINSDDERWFADRVPQNRLLRLRAGVGVPLSLYETTPVTEARRHSLLWAGEFSDRKRPVLALDVFSQIKRLLPDASMTMIGDGPLRSAVQTEVCSRGLSDAVTLPGRLPLFRVMPSHQVLIHTSAWEGLPRVGLEAAAMGRKSYAFDVKGVRDLPAAVLAPDNDVSGLADTVSNAMGDPLKFLTVDSHIREVLDSRIAADLIAKFAESVTRF